MAALVCDICGGKLMGKPGGIFECDSCGMQYDAAWAKEKIQEIKGTVKIEGTVEVQGTVQVDTTGNVEALLKRGNIALEDGAWKDAEAFFEQVLNINAENAEAYLGLFMATRQYSSVEHMEQVSSKQGLPVDDKNLKRAKQFAKDDLARTIARWEEEAHIAEEKRREKSRVAAARLAPVRARIAPVQSVISDSGFTPGLARIDSKAGLNADGTVIVCRSRYDELDVSNWTDIVAISVGGRHMVGLKADGTVIATGEVGFGRCDVYSWRDVVQVSAGAFHTVGLKADGTVVATGCNNSCECNVSSWRDIVMVAAGDDHTVGLKKDGSVVTTGKRGDAESKVPGWTDIVAIAAGGHRTVGLKSDGTVVATGNNAYGECDVSDWTNIVAIAAGDWHTVGLGSDGTVVAVGNTTDGRCDVSGWRDIVAIAAGGNSTVGLKADGTVVATESGSVVSSWKLFESVETIEQERAAAKVAAERQAEQRRLEAARKAEQKRIEAENRTARKLALSREKSDLMNELINLKGLFTGKRRREIESRIAEIDYELKGL